jgi:hypothetical protein
MRTLAVFLAAVAMLFVAAMTVGGDKLAGSRPTVASVSF